ncbi:MAG: T9SS type A sorting domain-containing protein [Flavobacteriales bacterium]|nr:T9SS type A sorting domain-containing protein [Flavobacteriales bacterium]
MLRWTIGITFLLALCQAQAQTASMVRGEYWIDQDLGIGLNIPFSLADDPDVPGVQLPVSLAGYSPGVHTIGLRTLDADGHWSPTNFSKAVVIEVPPVPPSDLSETEYFLNEDPGFGNALTAWTGSTADAVDVMFNPDLSNAATGVSTLFVRTRTSDGVWGLTNHRAVVVIEPEEPSDIVRIETFGLPGPDPGFGAADQHVVSTPATDLAEHVFDAPVPLNFNIYDTLMVRALDLVGRWSLTNRVIVDGSTSAEELSAAFAISTYPNPFTEGITVRTDDDKPLRVVLYDPQGKLVHDKVRNGESYIDLHGLASGTYTAFFWKEPERIHRVQLVKQ